MLVNFFVADVNSVQENHENFLFISLTSFILSFLLS